MSPLPAYPWEQVSVDFAGPLPCGKYLLVLVCEYSRYPIVEIVSSTAAKTVIPILERIFSEYSIPMQVKTDNGPPFSSHDFRQFAEYLGFKHRKITPEWPRANAEVERFMRTIEKAIRAATVEGKNWRQELYKFLRNYRATPHCSTTYPPSELLFGRKPNIRLPQASSVSHACDAEVRRHDTTAKERMKKHSDQALHTKPSHIQIGDTVLARQPRKHKLSPPFNPQPRTVVAVKGSMVTAEANGHSVTRNSSHFKRVAIPNQPASYHAQSDPEDTDDELDIAPATPQETGGGPETVTPAGAPTRKRYPQRPHRPPDYFGSA